MSAPRKPSLFIGSSGESLPAAQALCAKLSGIAEVTLWSEHPDFQNVGALFPLVLLQQPERFDFAAMVLGPADEVLTDQGTFTVPRDNVIFELGLFMGHLGRERTFMVVPRGDTSVNDLSDLSGVIWARYDPPEGMEDAVRAISAKIREKDREQLRRNVVAYDGPPNVPEFAKTLLNEAKRLWRREEHVTVWNFALDMSQTWGPMYEHLAGPDIRNLTWRSVMLDHKWPPFKEFESMSVSIRDAKHYEESIQEFCSTNEDQLRERNVTFECRTYRSIPVIHGFLVNGSFLICTILRRSREGRVICLNNAYLRFPHYNEISKHPIDAYSDWFTYAWETSKRWVWPPNPKSARAGGIAGQ